MNETNTSVDSVKEILNQMPATFQKFVSIYKEAEMKLRNKPVDSSSIQECTDEECEKPLDESEIDTIRTRLSDIGLRIMKSIRNEGSSSKDLAETIGVSIDTIKRRYKDLVMYGLIKASTRCGVRLTHRGLQFIRGLKDHIKPSIEAQLDALDAKKHASNATNASN